MWLGLPECYTQVLHMVLAMGRSVKHRKTGVYWFRKRVPADIAVLTGRREVNAYPGALVYFIEGGAIPAGISQAAVQMSEDRRIWRPLPEGIGKVTGKLAEATECSRGQGVLGPPSDAGRLAADGLAKATKLSIDFQRIWRS